MNWFTYDFFDPLLPSEKWRSNDASSVPQYIQDLAVDLPERIGVIRCNDWSTDDYVGGIKTFESRVCVFRVCNGGRDNRGRPHRWVLLAFENELTQGRSFDVLHALESIVFKRYAAAPVPSPAPFPSSALEWQPFVRLNSSAFQDKLSIQGDDAERQIRDVSFWMTSGKAQGALLIVEKQKSQFRAWFRKTVPPSPIAQSKITDSQRTPPLQVPQENATSTTSETPNMKKHMFIKASLVLAVVVVGVVGGVLGWFARDWWHKLPISEPPTGPTVTEVKLTKLDENGGYSLRLPFSVQDVQVHWLEPQEDGNYAPKVKRIERPKHQSSETKGTSPSLQKTGSKANEVHGDRQQPGDR